MKDFVTLALVMLSVIIAIPCICLGVLGLSGSAGDTSYAENVQFGVRYLGIGAAVLMPTAYWMYIRLKRS